MGRVDVLEKGRAGGKWGREEVEGDQVQKGLIPND